MNTYGLIAYVTAVTLFISFTIWSYNSTMSQNYISVSFDEQHCERVPIQIANKYYAGKIEALAIVFQKSVKGFVYVLLW